MRKPRLRGARLTPALVISMLALFVALSGTGVAAQIVPLAKRALSADKAKVATTANKAKLATVANRAKVADLAKTATNAATADTATAAVDAQTLGGQTAAQIAATPGPASALPVSLFAIRSVGWSVQIEGDKTDARALCSSGEKAVAGGWDQANGVAYILADRPIPDGSGWFVRIWADSGDTVPANGSVWVMCAKVS